jgi:hypothetical protein
VNRRDLGGDGRQANGCGLGQGPGRDDQDTGRIARDGRGARPVPDGWINGDNKRPRRASACGTAGAGWAVPS